MFICKHLYNVEPELYIFKYSFYSFFPLKNFEMTAAVEISYEDSSIDMNVLKKLNPENSEIAKGLLLEIETECTKANILDDTISQAHDHLNAAATIRKQIAQESDKITELESSISQTTHNVAHMRTRIQSFPTPERIHSLETQVAAKSDALDTSTSTLGTLQNDKKTQQRQLDDTHSNLSSLMHEVCTILCETSSLLQQRHREMVELPMPSVSLPDLTAQCTEREARLRATLLDTDLKKQKEKSIREAMECARTELATQCGDVERSHLESTQQITEEWSREQKELWVSLAQLRVIHKEQVYHLQRGTHIKQSTSGGVSSESRLAREETALTRELIQIQQRIKDATDQLHSRRVVLRNYKTELRKMKDEFEETRKKVQEQLQESAKEHRELFQEKCQLQKMKADMEDQIAVLHSARSPALMTPKKEI